MTKANQQNAYTKRAIIFSPLHLNDKTKITIPNVILN